MIKYLVTKAGEACVAILGVMTLVFFVTRLLGDPVTLMLPVGASLAQIDELRGVLGLDLPLWQQYLSFIGNALQGDFGHSFTFNRPAMEVVLERLPATAELASTSLVIGTALGVTIGTIAAVYRGTIVEVIALFLVLLGQATPVFWLGIMMILFFAVEMGWLPTGGYGTWQHMMLPALTVAVFISASIARLLRSSILDIIREDYIRTARAKGLRPRTVLTWHVMRNALIPVVTMLGILVGELLGGAVVTETVFAWPGVGRLIYQAIQQNDFPLIQASVAFIAFVFITANFVVDLLCAVLDPRIKLA